MNLLILIKEQFGVLPGGQPNRISDSISHEEVRNVEITKVTADSRQVIPGALFVAVRGENFDGHAYLQEAVGKGAAALVGEGVDPDYGAVYFQVRNSRIGLANLSAAWHGFPARKLIMIGVTGTDGKTTTSNLIFEILRHAGYSIGMITSVQAQIDANILDTGLHVTTPGASEVQGLLAEMVDSGITHCVLETTSHGLAQHRVAACEFDIGVLTNITHEHIDYHGSFEAYRDAKTMLFKALSEGALKENGPERIAILNRDDASFEYVHRATGVRQVSYGLSKDAQVRATEVQASKAGLTFNLTFKEHQQGIFSPMIGEYNVINCLAAAATAIEGLGISFEETRKGILAMKGVPGRMEKIDLGQPFLALVDFAHTPNSLRQVLNVARKLTRGKVTAVFGSAGLRDREKRKMMAQISLELADLTILTAEDPRTESLDDILSEMAEGARSAGGIEGEDYLLVPDRGEALCLAVRRAGAGDVLLACGKGHEQSMCFEETEHPWDDRVALRAALSEWMGVPGPVMPELPTSEGEG